MSKLREIIRKEIVEILLEESSLDIKAAHTAIQNALKPFKEMYDDPDDKKTVEDYAKKQMNKDSFFKEDPKSLDEKDLKRTIKYYTHQLQRRDKWLRSQEKKGFLGNQHFAKVSHQADTIILQKIAERLQKYIDAYQWKSEGVKSKKINESIPRDKSIKVANIFNNTPGFSYYAGQNDSSIVAPSTNNKKWYGKIRDMLDKANIGDYSLHPSQKPGYFILIFENKNKK